MQERYQLESCPVPLSPYSSTDSLHSKPSFITAFKVKTAHQMLSKRTASGCPISFQHRLQVQIQRLISVCISSFKIKTHYENKYFIFTDKCIIAHYLMIHRPLPARHYRHLPCQNRQQRGIFSQETCMHTHTITHGFQGVHLFCEAHPLISLKILSCICIYISFVSRIFTLMFPLGQGTVVSGSMTRR